MTDTAPAPGGSSLDAEQVGYHQSLGRRQVQMIAIGGAIGTGLFLGSASRLHNNGPALVISYGIVGIIAFLLMRALGELVLHRPTSGAFVSYMREFYGEKAAYVTGWLYWMNWALTGIAELSAVGTYAKHWWPNLPAWITVLIALAVVLAVNLLSAKAFGEFEFWASVIKVTAIAVFLVVGLVVVIGRLHVGDHRAGVSNLWNNPGGFWPHGGTFGYFGPVLVMSGVVFAYAAIELVGVAAGEMAEPAREVPRAVNSVIFRIAVFYCGSLVLLACMLPTSMYTKGTSPFVSVFDRMGVSWMADVIQVVLIVAAMSSLNSGLYSTGRILRSLAIAKQAPAFTLKMSKLGVPWSGIVMTSVVYLAGAILNAVKPSDAFEIALEAASIGVVATWASVFLAQIRLRQLTDRGVIPAPPFRMPGAPFTSYLGLAFLAFVLFGMAYSGWYDGDTLLKKTNFLVVVFGIPVVFLLLVLGWFAVRGNVAAHTGGRMKAVWSNTGPTYPDQRQAVADSRGPSAEDERP